MLIVLFLISIITIKSVISTDMKIMRAFQIEHDYQRHREKLLSIKCSDVKKKVTLNTNKSIDKINNYRRVKANSFFGQSYAKDREIMNTNEHLHRTLMKVYRRDPKSAIVSEISQH